MKRTVRYGSSFLDQADERFPAERSLAYSGMTYGEFMNGPVRAARRAFELRWEQQHPEAGGAVRTAFIAPRRRRWARWCSTGCLSGRRPWRS